jgi:hypothetical protein
MKFGPRIPAPSSPSICQFPVDQRSVRTWNQFVLALMLVAVSLNQSSQKLNATPDQDHMVVNMSDLL